MHMKGFMNAAGFAGARESTVHGYTDLKGQTETEKQGYIQKKKKKR